MENKTKVDTGTGVVVVNNADKITADSQGGSSITVTPINSKEQNEKDNCLVDRYGFFQSDRRYHHPTSAENKQMKENIWIENNRTQKWRDMVGNQFENFKNCSSTAKFKKRVRKGIPEAMRSDVWERLLNANTLQEQNPFKYHDYLKQTHVPYEDTILRDIGRTFPRHSMFSANSSMSGQHSLYNILKAYSLYDPEVGYCQGMGFIAALFLTYIPEEKAFWCLVSCMTNPKHLLADVFRPSMPKANELMWTFNCLLGIHLPMVSKHLSSQGLEPSMYASQWFLTVFTYNFSFDFVTRIWDIFLHEGWKIVYRVALAFLQINKKKLLESHFESMMELFKELPYSVATNEVIITALSIPLKTRDLDKLKEKYQIEKNK